MKYFAFFIYLTLTTLISTGCSIIGLAIGANTETEEVYYKNIESDSPEFKSLELVEGDSLTIFTNNGDSLSGIFIQFKNLSIEEYTTEFMNTFKNEIYFPKLQDTLWTFMGEEVVNYRFLGFKYEYILLRDVKNDTIAIPLNEPFFLLEEENRMLFSAEEYIELIRNRNENVKAVSYNRYIQIMNLFAEQKKGKILIKDEEQISIKNIGDDVHISISDIDKIIVPYRKDYALSGFLVGLGIDALVIIIWLQSDPFTYQMDLELK